MYILKVLVEHNTYSLKDSFYYVYNEEVKKGSRVNITFNNQHLVGFVVETIYQDLSLKDADLRAIGKEADTLGNNTLVVSDNAFRFLENYGFEIISLDEETLTESSLENIRSYFDDELYDTIIVLDNNYTDAINGIIEDYEANVIDINSMITYDEINNDCLANMQTFIDNIRNLTLTE